MRLLREPLLARHTLTAHTLTAGTKLTAARLLLSRHAPLLSLRPFLSRLLEEEEERTVSREGEGEGWKVTALELVSAAVKTLSSLFDHLTSSGSKVNSSSYKPVSLNFIIPTCTYNIMLSVRGNFLPNSTFVLYLPQIALSFVKFWADS